MPKKPKSLLAQCVKSLQTLFVVDLCICKRCGRDVYEVEEGTGLCPFCVSREEEC